MTLQAITVGYVRLTLALQSAPALDRLNLATIGEPKDRLSALLFARVWNERLRSRSQTIFS
jgi:hypothetical protein